MDEKQYVYLSPSSLREIEERWAKKQAEKRSDWVKNVAWTALKWAVGAAIFGTALFILGMWYWG